MSPYLLTAPPTSTLITPHPVAAEPFNATLPGYNGENQHKPGDKYWEGSLDNASDVRGSVVVIERGIATFEDKYIVAVKAGGEYRPSCQNVEQQPTNQPSNDPL